MPEITESEKAIFRVAVSLTDTSERETFLRQACGSDDHLLRQLERLLAADDAADRFLKSPAELSDFTDENSLLEKQSEQIGRYKLLQKIGEGGFGVVYMAEQQQPVVRMVALKVIKLGMDTKQVVARFEAERQALAMMDHPHIAKVLDGGATETGRPFFVMDLVRGIPVTEYCDQKQLTNQQRLSLFLDICGAIQHAHQKGIIHRDIKPTNILVTLHDGQPVPKVIDFGIAKATLGRLTDKTLFTRFDQFIGTPAYMSPEQAEMSGTDIDTRSDIYSLGVLLYELLTGQTPFDREELAGVGHDELRRRIREQEPPNPSTRLSSLEHEVLSKVAQNRRSDPARLPALLRGDLDWIVMKAVEKDRTRRYATADAFAEDIKRHLNGDPVSAVPPSTTYLVRKFMRRNRRLLVTMGIVTATLFIASLVSGWQALNAIDARNRLASEVVAKGQAVDRAMTAQQAARHAQAQAQAGESRARQLAYTSDMNRAYQALRLNNLGLARRLVERNRAFPDGTDLRNWEWRALWLQRQGDAVSTFGDRRDSIESMSISRDGKWLAVGEYRGGIRVWNVSTGKLAHTLLRNDAEQRGLVAFAPGGDRLYATAAGGVVKSWIVPSFAESDVELRHGSPVRDLCISSDGNILAMYGIDTLVSVWDLNSSSKRISLLGGDRNGGAFGTIAISPDNQLLAIGNQWKIKIFDLNSFEERPAIPHPGFSALAFSPDSQVLASAKNIIDRTVYLHRVSDGQLIHRLEGHSFYVFNVDFSPDGRLLASASADHTVRLWDTETGTQSAVLRGHDSEVWDLEFTADGQRLISGGKNGEICVWNPNEGGLSRWPITVPLPGLRNDSLERAYSQASFSPDGAWLATRNLDKSVSLRSTKTLKEVRQLADLGTNNRGVRFSPADGLLAVGDADGNLALLFPENPGELTRVKLAEGAEIFPVSFSRDGKRLLVVARDETKSRCIICAVPGGHQTHSWVIPSDERRAALSPDGKLVVTGHNDGTARFWTVTDPREPIVVPYGNTVEGIAFSPDGKSLVVGLESGEAEILEVATRRRIGRLLRHMQAVHSVQFSPDGKRVATGGGPGESVKIWDLATRQELMTLVVDGFYFGQVEFSPDGNAILAINGNGKLNLWRVPS